MLLEVLFAWVSAAPLTVVNNAWRFRFYATWGVAQRLSKDAEYLQVAWRSIQST